jgi:hypothetical protein
MNRYTYTHPAPNVQINLKDVIFDTIEVAIIYLGFCLIVIKILYLVEVSFKKANRFNAKYKNIMNAIRNENNFVEGVNENDDVEDDIGDTEDDESSETDSDGRGDLDIDIDNDNWETDSEDASEEEMGNNETNNSDSGDSDSEREEDANIPTEFYSESINSRLSAIEKYNTELSEQLDIIETKISNQDNVFIYMNSEIQKILCENQTSSQKLISIEKKISRMHSELLEEMYNLYAR